MDMERMPPGIRFVPTDDELVEYYLSKKVRGEPLPCDQVVHDCEIYGDKEPWKIFGETNSEICYVFTKLRNKGNGRRIDRTAGSGTWKGERTDPVMDSEENHVRNNKLFTFKVDGVSKNDQKGHWIMREFSLINKDQVDDWVLCRIYNKNNPNRSLEHGNDDNLGNIPPSVSMDRQYNEEDDLFDIDAMVGSDAISNGLVPDQLGYSDLSMVNPLKRTLPLPYCIEDETVWPSTSKRLRGDSNEIDGGSLDIATLPSQLLTTPPLQQHHQQQQQQQANNSDSSEQFWVPGPNWSY